MKKLKDITIISPMEFNFEAFTQISQQKRSRGNPGTKSKIRYKDIITAFDIETTRIRAIEQSIMYIWQWAFNDDLVVVGRTWDEFTDFTGKISSCLKDDEKLVVMVFNLSYEFQFLKGIYHFRQDDVFCMDSRKVLKCTINGNIEFRCSYLHTNMNLDTYTNKMNVKHQKLSGDEFDYSKQRYPWTELTDRELEYCINDVIGLVEATKIEMLHDGDNIYSFPLTSTGYVRRDAKRAMQQVNHLWVKKQTPTLHLYEMLREAFRGGNTHANRFFASNLIEYPENAPTPIYSVDRSSSYPDVLINHKFPYDRFYEIGTISDSKFHELYDVMHRAILMRVSIDNIYLKTASSGCPYLSKDKCRNIYNGIYDNGRILQADHIETTITDVDYKLICDMYEFDNISYDDVAYTRYGYLPSPFTDLICEYYRRKTALKNVPGEELQYFRDKQKLNSLYGMTCQSVKQSVLFVDDEYILEDTPIEELLFENNRRRQLPNYQVGVWVTAWGRYELQRCIDIVENTPGAMFLYTDTDSIKYVGNVDFSEYNDEKIRESKEHGAFATDPQGVTHYTGVFEKEAESKKFITLGAKKYAYEDMQGKLHITVAGVIKDKGAAEMEKAGGIKCFEPNFVFVEGGGLEAVYNDDPEVKEYEIEGHKLKITSNVVLRDSTYTLGITNEYEQLLSISHNYRIDLF